MQVINRNGQPSTRPEIPAFTIIRVSREDQLKGYGPDTQWEDDVLPNAAAMGLIATLRYRRIIQEPATGWERPRFEEAVREAVSLYRAGEIEGVLFPRVDRETRNLLFSIPILYELLRSGLKVFFARERFQLRPDDEESWARYVNKAQESRGYVETLRTNTMQGRRRRMERDGMMPTGKSRWPYEYHPYRRDWGKPPDANSGRYTAIPERVAIVKEWVKWVLEEGASLSECHRRTLKQYGAELGRSAIAHTLQDPIIIGKVFAYRSRNESGPQGTRNIRLPESDWKLVYENPDLAIITEEQFQALRVKFQRNRENSPRNVKNWYPPIRGMVFCSSCGKKMSGQFRGGRQPGFRCIPCHRWVKAVPLWDEIQAKVREIVLRPDLLAAALQSRLDNGEAIEKLEAEIKEINKKLIGLARAEEKALRLYLYVDDEGRETISEDLLRSEQSRIASRRKELQRKEAELRQQAEALTRAKVDAEGIQMFMSNASANLDNWDEARWGILLEALNLRIVAYDNRIDVEMSVPSLEEGESVTMYPTSPCGPRPTSATKDITGSIEIPGALRNALRPGALSSATFPTNRWGGSSRL